MDGNILSISADAPTADAPASGSAETNNPSGGEQNQQVSTGAQAPAVSDAPQVDAQQPLNNVVPLTGRPSDQPTNPLPGQPLANQPADAGQQPPAEELTPEVIAELAKPVATDSTPIKQLRNALGRSDARATALQQEIETLKTRPDIPPERMEQYNAARDFQVKFTQIPVDPDEALKFAQERLAEFKEINPIVAEQAAQINFWEYGFNKDGTPNKENFQAILDTMPLPNKVSVDDVFNAIDALANGRLGSEDLDFQLSDAEKAFRAEQAKFQEQNKATQERWQKEMDARETEVRTTATKSVVQNISQQFETGLKTHLNTLNLMPKADDTPEVQRYKGGLLDGLGTYVAKLESQNADFQYIRQRIETLNKPQKIDSDRARTQVEQVANSLDFQERLARGIRDISDKAREYANEKARDYSRWLRGGDDPQVANAVNGARVEPGSTGWKAPLTNGVQPQTGMSAIDAGAQALAQAREAARRTGIG